MFLHKTTRRSTTGQIKIVKKKAKRPAWKYVTIVNLLFLVHLTSAKGGLWCCPDSEALEGCPRSFPLIVGILALIKGKQFYSSVIRDG